MGAPVSPTQRALAECKRRGYEAQVVERFNSFTKRRHDLFGCIDIVAVTPAPPPAPTMVDEEGPFSLGPPGRIIGIQVTSGTNHAARIAKIKAEPRMAAWAKAGGLLWVWSWALRGGRGKRKTYQLRETEVVL